MAYLIFEFDIGLQWPIHLLLNQVYKINYISNGTINIQGPSSSAKLKSSGRTWVLTTMKLPSSAKLQSSGKNWLPWNFWANNENGYCLVFASRVCNFQSRSGSDQRSIHLVRSGTRPLSVPSSALNFCPIRSSIRIDLVQFDPAHDRSTFYIESCNNKKNSIRTELFRFGPRPGCYPIQSSAWLNSVWSWIDAHPYLLLGATSRYGKLHKLAVNYAFHFHTAIIIYRSKNQENHTLPTCSTPNSCTIFHNSKLQ